MYYSYWSYSETNNAIKQQTFLLYDAKKHIHLLHNMQNGKVRRSVTNITFIFMPEAEAQ